MTTLPDASLVALAEADLTEADLDGVTIVMNDVRLAGYCGPGLSTWLPAHGFDLRDFVRNGLPARDMIATGDAHGIRVVVGRLKRGA